MFLKITILIEVTNGWILPQDISTCCSSTIGSHLIEQRDRLKLFTITLKVSLKLYIYICVQKFVLHFVIRASSIFLVREGKNEKARFQTANSVATSSSITSLSDDVMNDLSSTLIKCFLLAVLNSDTLMVSHCHSFPFQL